jgi:sporulation protein YlmC with PRC-barrel domain
MASAATSASNRRIISMSELTGMPIEDRDGHKIGAIKEVLLDRETGAVQFVLATTGGLFSVGDKYHPLPWSLLRFRASPEGYTGAFSKDQLKDAPAYDREQLASPSYGWDEQVHRYFQGLGLASGPAVRPDVPTAQPWA